MFTEYYKQLQQALVAINIIFLAKIILSIFMLAISVIGVYVLLNFTRWYTRLTLLETTAERLRDETMTTLTATRARLYTTRKKIKNLGSIGNASQELLNEAGSALKLVLKQERSILKWGMLGVRVANVALTYWKNR